jgi:hypothetical protein
MSSFDIVFLSRYVFESNASWSNVVLMQFFCIGMTFFGTPQLYWLVIVLEVLYSKAWWLKSNNIYIKGLLIYLMLLLTKVAKGFWKSLKGQYFVVCHMLEVVKVFKNIFLGNANKSIQ